MNLSQLTFSNLKKVFRESIVLGICIMFTTFFSTYLVFNVLTPPTYISSFQVLFNATNNKVDSLQLDSYKTNIQLMSTVSSIIKSSKVMEEVKKELVIEDSAKEASKKVNVKSDTNSLVLNVDFSSDNSKEVELVSYWLLKIIQTEIPETFRNSTITVLEQPNAAKKVSLLPNYVLSFFIGMFIFSTFVIVKSTFDTRIRTPEQVKGLGIIYLGDIPKVKNRRR